MRAPVQCVILFRASGFAAAPALSLGGRPFLDYLLLEARRFGFRKVLLLAEGTGAWAKAALEASRIEADMRLPVEASEGATCAAALMSARDRLDAHFLLLDGCCWFDFNWLSLSAADGASAALATVAVRGFTGERPRQAIDPDNALARAVGPAPAAWPSDGVAGTGVALLSARILEHLAPAQTLDEVLVRLVGEGAARVVAPSGRFIDLADRADRARAGAVAPWRHRPAVFLDRDGTLDADTGFVRRKEDFRWLPGSMLAVRQLNESGYYVFVVTNQSGVARGLFDETTVRDLNRWMNEELRAAGAHIDDMRYCPHHPDAGRPPYRMACQCRKPAPGMVLDLLARWPVIAKGSIALGDSERDATAGRAAGIAGEIVPPGGLPRAVAQLLGVPPPARPAAGHSDPAVTCGRT